MWRDFSLGDHIEALSGFAFSSAHFSSDGSGLPLIRIRDIGSASTEIGYSGPYEQRYVVNRGEILIGMDGEFLVRKWAGEPGLLNQRVLKLFARPGSELNIDFTYYWLGPYLKSVEDKTPETTVKHLSVRTVEAARVRAPDLPQQRKIAAVLSALDAQIERTEALIAKQEQVRAGLMQDLFTRGVDKSGRLRPPHEEAPELYHETELGWLPKGWSARKLDGLLAAVPTPMRSGPFGSALLKHELVENGVPLLGIDNVFPEQFVANFRRFVSPSKFAELERYRVLPHDVIITIMGTVGRCCVVPIGLGEMLSSKHIWTMTFDRQQVLPDLICWQLNFAPWVASWFRREGQGGIMEAIQSSTLRRLLLPTPEIAEQYRIQEVYFDGSRPLGELRQEATKLRLQRSGLMQDLLTGKVPVEILLNKRAAA